ADEVGQLGDDDALAAGADVLERHGRPGAEGSASGLIGLAHTVEADDPTARGQIGPGNEAHEFGQTGVRVAGEMRAGGDARTAMPDAPLMSRFGKALGSTSGWVSVLS